MILQALVKYYENLAEQGKVSRLGWCHAKVSYEINLSSEGDIIGITSRKIADMRGKKVVWVPANLVVPEMVTRSSGVAANFLCDNSKYMLGIDADGTNSRVVDCFQATKEKHGQILQSAQGKTARAILAYLKMGSAESIRTSCDSGKLGRIDRRRQSYFLCGRAGSTGRSGDSRLLGKLSGAEWWRR